MHIALRLDPSRTLRWHQWLAAGLSDAPGRRVSIVFTKTPHPLPLSCRLLLQLEGLIYGRGSDHAMDPADKASWQQPGADDDNKHLAFDVLVDLSNSDEALPRCRRALTPLFNGAPGELGAIMAILNGAALRIEVHDNASETVRLTAAPATADRRVLAIALDAVLSRAAELMLKAIDQPAAAADDNRSPAASTPNLPGYSTTIAHLGRTLRDKVIARIGRILAGGHAWSVAYRLDAALSLLDQRGATFVVLRDDRRRYYADPFPFNYRGRSYLFVEEFPFATNRGCISVVALDTNGAAPSSRIVIEEPHHLSYPFVFEQDGQIWMIPESGAANRIDLYRAARFPDRWVREATLLEGIAAYDATLTRRNGRFWMFVTLARWNSTSRDNLSLFQARQLTGPWTAHAQNPILLDARHSRCGGALFERNGALLRPAQDCSSTYGGALDFNRVDVLNETDFRQTEVGRISCGTFGCHTYNRHAGIEAIDLFGATFRLGHVNARYAPAIMATSMPNDPPGQQPASAAAISVT
jgi:hypothetical protein